MNLFSKSKKLGFLIFLKQNVKKIILSSHSLLLFCRSELLRIPTDGSDRFKCCT